MMIGNSDNSGGWGSCVPNRMYRVQISFYTLTVFHFSKFSKFS